MTSIAEKSSIKFFTRFDTWSGMVFMSGLGILSIVFYLERALCGDQVYHTYKAMEAGGPFYTHGRVLTALFVTVPGFMSRFSMPENMILLSYSVTNWMVHFFLWATTAFLLRRPDYALAIPLMFAVGIRHTFFYACSDTLLGLSFLVPLLTFLSSKRHVGFFSALFVIFYSTMMIRWIHYSLFIPVQTIILLDLFRHQRYKQAWRWISFLFITIIFCILISKISSNTYVGNKVYYTKLPTSDAFYSIAVRLFSIAKWPVLSCGIICMFLLLKRQLPKIAACMITFFMFSGYVLILVLKERVISSGSYLEHIALPLTGIVMAAGMIWVFPNMKRTYRRIVISALLLFGFIGIWQTHYQYSNYVKWLDSTTEILSKEPTDKFIWMDKRCPLGMTWHMPVQSLLFSSAKSSHPCTIIMMADEEKVSKLTEEDNKFAQRSLDNKLININDLPPPLKLNTSKYHVLEKNKIDLLMSTFKN